MSNLPSDDEFAGSPLPGREFLFSDVISRDFERQLLSAAELKSKLRQAFSDKRQAGYFLAEVLLALPKTATGWDEPFQYLADAARHQQMVTLLVEAAVSDVEMTKDLLFAVRELRSPQPFGDSKTCLSVLSEAWTNSESSPEAVGLLGRALISFMNPADFQEALRRQFEVVKNTHVSAGQSEQLQRYFVVLDAIREAHNVSSDHKMALDMWDAEAVYLGRTLEFHKAVELAEQQVADCYENPLIFCLEQLNETLEPVFAFDSNLGDSYWLNGLDAVATNGEPDAVEYAKRQIDQCIAGLLESPSDVNDDLREILRPIFDMKIVDEAVVIVDGIVSINNLRLYDLVSKAGRLGVECDELNSKIDLATRVNDLQLTMDRDSLKNLLSGRFPNEFAAISVSGGSAHLEYATPEHLISQLTGYVPHFIIDHISDWTASGNGRLELDSALSFRPGEVQLSFRRDENRILFSISTEDDGLDVLQHFARFVGKPHELIYTEMPTIDLYLGPSAIDLTNLYGSQDSSDPVWDRSGDTLLGQWITDVKVDLRKIVGFLALVLEVPSDYVDLVRFSPEQIGAVERQLHDCSAAIKQGQQSLLELTDGTRSIRFEFVVAQPFDRSRSLRIDEAGMLHADQITTWKLPTDAQPDSLMEESLGLVRLRVRFSGVENPELTVGRAMALGALQPHSATIRRDHLSSAAGGWGVYFNGGNLSMNAQVPVNEIALQQVHAIEAGAVEANGQTSERLSPIAEQPSGVEGLEGGL